MRISTTLLKFLLLQIVLAFWKHVAAKDFWTLSRNGFSFDRLKTQYFNLLQSDEYCRRGSVQLSFVYFLQMLQTDSRRFYFLDLSNSEIMHSSIKNWYRKLKYIMNSYHEL